MSPRAVDHLNVGLMLGALAAAFALPFEVFLVAYAVLGPLHYLTQISWLQERGFYTRGRRDWIALLVLLALVVLGQSYVLGSWHVAALAPHSGQLIFLAFAWAFVLAFFAPGAGRVLAGIAALLLVSLAGGEGTTAWLLFALFVPTILHVCAFTGAFLLYGALKGRRASGYFAFAVFVGCCLAALLAPAAASDGASGYVAKSYVSFAPLNSALAGVFGLGEGASAGPFAPFGDYAALLTSAAGVTVMRFVAFCYAYHYLNWFSKTSIIRWHEVDRRKLAAAGVIWIASLALYAKDFDLGARWLFLLSLGHVLLEFPLNHVSFVGIGRELLTRARPSLARGAPVR